MRFELHVVRERFRRQTRIRAGDNMRLAHVLLALVAKDETIVLDAAVEFALLFERIFDFEEIREVRRDFDSYFEILRLLAVIHNGEALYHLFPNAAASNQGKR